MGRWVLLPGTAGVLLVALIWGVIINFIPSFQIGERVITIWSDKIKGNFGIVSNIGTALFVTAVGLIAGPKFFRSFNKSTLAYIVLGFVIIIIGGAPIIAALSVQRMGVG